MKSRSLTGMGGPSQADWAEYAVGDFDYGVVDRIVDAIVSGFSPAKIIIFGSVASHTATSDSDVDILVVMDTDERPVRRSIPLRVALSDILVGKDILVVTPEEFEEGKDEEFSFIHEVVRTGCVVYESGPGGDRVLWTEASPAQNI